MLSVGDKRVLVLHLRDEQLQERVLVELVGLVRASTSTVVRRRRRRRGRWGGWRSSIAPDVRHTRTSSNDVASESSRRRSRSAGRGGSSDGVDGRRWSPTPRPASAPSSRSRSDAAVGDGELTGLHAFGIEAIAQLAERVANQLRRAFVVGVDRRVQHAVAHLDAHLDPAELGRLQLEPQRVGAVGRRAQRGQHRHELLGRRRRRDRGRGRAVPSSALRRRGRGRGRRRGREGRRAGRASARAASGAARRSDGVGRRGVGDGRRGGGRLGAAFAAVGSRRGGLGGCSGRAGVAMVEGDGAGDRRERRR